MRLREITDTEATGNRLYILANATEAGDLDRDWDEWKANHPHINDVKDAEQSPEYIAKHRKKIQDAGIQI